VNVSESTVPGLTEAPSPAETPLLSVRDLKIHFATKRGVVHAVDGTNFDIHEGETLGLVGETGSGKSVTARSLLQLVPRPPGIFAGGHAMFHPKVTCPACSGAGCEKCGETGRVTAPCRSCSGSGCEKCDHSGQQTVDLLTASIRRMRAIRGNHIAMIFQDPGKALNPAMTIRDQVAEVLAEHQSSNLPKPDSTPCTRTSCCVAMGIVDRRWPKRQRCSFRHYTSRTSGYRPSLTSASPERWRRRASPIPARSCSGIRTSCLAA